MRQFVNEKDKVIFSDKEKMPPIEDFVARNGTIPVMPRTTTTTMLRAAMLLVNV